VATVAIGALVVSGVQSYLESIDSVLQQAK
jgi:hypothetical protein